MKRTALTFVVTVLFMTIGAWVMTDPGEITASPRNGVIITPSYLDQLKVEAERTGKVIVWTGAGYDFRGSAVLFDSVPILMDKEDVGRPLDDIKDRNVRRTIEAVKVRLNHEMPNRAAFREFTRAGLGDFASAVEKAAAEGGMLHATQERILSLEEQALLLDTAVKARGESEAMTEGMEYNPPMYEPGGCGYGDVCDGCYTVYYRQRVGNRTLTSCAYACTNCPII